MQYLKSFTFASEDEELKFLLTSAKLEMDYARTCAYPFKLFPLKGLRRLDFEPLTIIYGGNGSGKSTVLNIIAEKLRLRRLAPFNNTPLIENYLEFCKYEIYNGTKNMPDGSEIITSDGVFDYLLDVRAVNDGIDRQREALFEEYTGTVEDCRNNHWQIGSLADYEELKRRNEVRRGSKSKYAARRMTKTDTATKSNGESAFVYFTQKINDNALYLLDEPENSLSASLQRELAVFLSDSARFYNCQFIISTHSPFLLSMSGAKIYDLDANPVSVKKWTELENVRAYYELFRAHGDEFEK